MKILFLSGYFEKPYEAEIIDKTKTYVEYAANAFEEKLINGFKNNGQEISVFSAPFIGAFPTAYKDIYFGGFKGEKSKEVNYVKFLNIWGIRNISRAAALKRALKKYIKENKNEEILVLVYSPHTPFLEAADFVKSRCYKAKICLVVPDLPQYMNLATEKRAVYDFFKKFDIKKFYRLSENIDFFVLLTEQMKDILKVGNRPYAVVEGICDDLKEDKQEETQIKTIAYTGKLNEVFGVKNLVESFMKIENDNLRLIIAGSGELSAWVEEKAKEDGRIIFKGQIPMSEAKKIIAECDICVNPRENNSEYTKYSFPSKLIDYLSQGKKTVAFKLDGMPEIYKEFIFSAEPGIDNAINEALNSPNKTEKFREYANKNLRKEAVADRILNMVEK